MIPRVIHFVWIGGPMPEWALRNICQFRSLNPDYAVRIHGEDALDPTLRAVYDTADQLASKADIIRYCVLAREGGWYFDTDFWPLRPLDDAIRAWQLDGSKLYISKIRGHLSGDRMPYANGILACEAGNAAMEWIIDRVRNTPYQGTVTYGPALFNDLVREIPRSLVIAEAPWWFPVTINQTKVAVPYLVAGRHDELRLLTNYTLGQLPFGAHLWNGYPRHDLAKLYQQGIDDTPVALVEPHCQHGDHPLGRISTGLEALGFYVSERLPIEDSWVMKDPDVICCWNGRQPNNAFAKLAREVHIPCLYLEHGYFQRREYTQADHRGILHWSSWREKITDAPPAGAYDRLAFFHPGWDDIDFMPRTGHILILGQVPGDSQMGGSIFDAAPAMLQQISRRLPGHYKAVFRPHPFAPPLDPASQRFYPNIILRDSSPRENQTYSQRMESPSLRDDLAAARCCIAINSNALVDATAMGIPCMAFGPALGIEAGVYRPTSLRTLTADLDAMWGGWHPDPERVKAFLAWLAWIQYSKAELEDPGIVAGLLRQAGVRGYADGQ